MRVLLALIRNDLRLAFRDKVVIFFNYGFPLVFFFCFAEIMNTQTERAISYVLSTVTIVGVLGNGLFGAGMRAVQERENQILRRFKVAPITPTPILCASIISGVLVYIPILGILLVLAHYFYLLPLPATWPSLIVLVILGTAAFRSMGLILAAVANSSQESNILIQVFYMPMLFLSGATFPITLIPNWAQILSQYLPASYLVVAFRGILLREESLADNSVAVGALILTLCLSLFIAIRLFRWDKEERISSSAKLSVVIALSPFLVLGTYQILSGDQYIQRAQQLWEIGDQTKVIENTLELE
jgi:ABC-2 type transport system permease protein